tara:strand:- start:829 stop:1038 length:210 start_codon:yes stop_codon:yes gene_type:complete
MRYDKITEQELKVTFCRTCRTCPSIEISLDSNDVIIGGEKEGISTFSKDEFSMLIEAAKRGIFDKYFNN